MVDQLYTTAQQVETFAFRKLLETFAFHKNSDRTFECKEL